MVCSTNMMYKTLLKRSTTAEEICKKMKQAWRLAGCDKQHHNNNDDNGNETALVNFKGKCHSSKKKGHKLKGRRKEQQEAMRRPRQRCLATTKMSLVAIARKQVIQKKTDGSSIHQEYRNGQRT